MAFCFKMNAYKAVMKVCTGKNSCSSTVLLCDHYTLASYFLPSSVMLMFLEAHISTLENAEKDPFLQAKLCGFL